MEDATSGEPTKITSISMPVDWWAIMKELATYRSIQGDSPNKGLNSVMVEVLGKGIEDARLELTERKRRKKRA